MSITFYILAIIFAVSLSLVAFLLVSAGDFAKFKSTFQTKKHARVLPIISKYGDLISTPQDLELHLIGLKTRLKEKHQELDAFKTKIHNRMENLQKFENYKKGCFEMQANLIKIEDECNDLYRKVDYFRKMQIRVQEDLAPGSGVVGDADWMSGPSRILL